MPSQPAPFRKILIATDFSESSRAALPRGIWLAEKAEAQAVVMHVITNLRDAFLGLPYAAKSEFLYGDIDKFEQALRAESQQRLKKSIQPFARKKLGLQTEVLLGKPDVAISRAVQHEQFDAVVVGTRGMTGAKRFFLGSTARRLVRQCPASVCVVKAENAWPPKRIAVGIDFSELSRRALILAGWLAAQSRASLDVVHVVEDEDVLSGLKSRPRDSAKGSDLGRQIEAETCRRMQEWCAASLDPSTLRALHVLWGTPAKVIADRIRRWKCDLAVFGTVGRSGLPGMLIGNTAEKLSSLCDCSLFTVKPPDFVSPILPPFWDLHPADEPHLISRPDSPGGRS